MTYSDDRIEHDDLKISGSAAYEDKNVGQGKTILVSGIRLDGDDAKNYTLVSATTRTTGDITARDLHVTAKVINGGSKVYDGTAAAQVSFGDDRVEQDAFDVSGAASYRDKNVGEAKSVDVTDIGISGADAGNYKLVNKVASTTADIAARPLIIRAVENKKTYDGKTTANVLPTIEGLQGSDRVSDLVEVYTDADAGREKTLVVAKYKLSDGNEGNNYLVQTIDCQKGVIEKAELTYVADYKERYVGEGNPVLTGTVTGFIPGETLESATTGQMVFITDAAASSPAGSYAVYGSGLKAKNYEFKQMSANQQALLVKKTVWQQTPATDAGQENTQSTQKKAATQDKLSGLAILQVLGDGSSGAAGNSVQGSKSRNEYSRDGSRDNENTTRRKVEKGNTLSHRKHNAGAGSGITFVHYNGLMSEITLIENTTGKFTLTDNMGIQDKNHGTEGVVKKISAFQVNHGKVQQHPIYTVSVKDNELSLMAAAQPPVIPDMVQTAEIKSTYVEINLGEDHMYSYHIGFNGHSLHIAPQNDNAVRRIAETASDGNKQIVAVAVLGALQDMELSLAQIEEVYIQVK